MRLHYLGVVLIAGCFDPVPAVESSDVARMVGATIATSEGGATMGAVTDANLLVHGVLPAGFVVDASSGMIFGTHGALEHQYVMIVCRDGENRVIKPCNQMTNTATMIASWSGSIAGPKIDLRSSRQGMWTLGNLQTWMPTITGSNTSLATEGAIGGVAYRLTATESETMVTPSSMMGGSIHLDLVVTRVGADTLETTADVVFDDAFRTASLTVDGEDYRVDLTTGQIE